MRLLCDSPRGRSERSAANGRPPFILYKRSSSSPPSYFPNVTARCLAAFSLHRHRRPGHPLSTLPYLRRRSSSPAYGRNRHRRPGEPDALRAREPVERERADARGIVNSFQYCRSFRNLRLSRFYPRQSARGNRTSVSRVVDNDVERAAHHEVDRPIASLSPNYFMPRSNFALAICVNPASGSGPCAITNCAHSEASRARGTCN